MSRKKLLVGMVLHKLGPVPRENMNEFRHCTIEFKILQRVDAMKQVKEWLHNENSCRYYLDAAAELKELTDSTIYFDTRWQSESVVVQWQDYQYRDGDERKWIAPSIESRMNEGSLDVLAKVTKAFQVAASHGCVEDVQPRQFVDELAKLVELVPVTYHTFRDGSGRYIERLDYDPSQVGLRPEDLKKESESESENAESEPAVA